MEPPKNKAELLQAMREGRREWEEALSRLSESDFRTPNVEGVWSVKDILAHICAYEQYMSAMLADWKDPNAMATAMLDSYYQTHLTMYRRNNPDLPDQVQQLRGDQVNELFTAAFRYKTVREVREMETQAYARLEEWVEQLTDDEITGPFTDTGSTLLHIIPRQCYTHYRMHLPAVQGEK
jgi:uncharacterized damage-inducible protein DinB